MALFCTLIIRAHLLALCVVFLHTHHHPCFLISSALASSSSSPLLPSLSKCLSQAGVSNTTSRSSPSSYSSLLSFSIQNLRFTESGTPTPDLLIFPSSPPQVQHALLCSLQSGYQIRVRSGGHSYEGLSSYGTAPFVIIDLMSMSSVSIHLASKSAWVEAGATLGEIYYSISQATSDYGFPAGMCPTVGSGGHFSGGGYGFLSRKYGTAADNVLDALLVDANGRLLDRESMGEDLFWAIRGGGGGSWGIVVKWKIRLVPVTRRVTSFLLARTGKHAVTELIYRWQTIAPKAPPELFVAINMAGVNTTNGTDIKAQFFGQYLGTTKEMMGVMGKVYPELGLTAGDCKEGRWIESVGQIAAVAVEDLKSRKSTFAGYFKGKSDYVRKAISREGIKGALSKLEEIPGNGILILEPYGGVMDTIGTGAIPFPHRAGTLYIIQYEVVWTGDAHGTEDASYIKWIRDLYSYMAPFVSHSPRAAYVNYIDLDLGTSSLYAQAESSWGQNYFLSNFPRLAHIKAQVDPLNVFTHPQGIPSSS